MAGYSAPVGPTLRRPPSHHWSMGKHLSQGLHACDQHWRLLWQCQTAAWLHSSLGKAILHMLMGLRPDEAVSRQAVYHEHVHQVQTMALFTSCSYSSSMCYLQVLQQPGMPRASALPAHVLETAARMLRVSSSLPEATR